MIRVLIIVAVTGFILSAASLSAAFALGGPDIVTRGGWGWASGDWKGRHWGWSDEHEGVQASGPPVTRTLAWSGADALEIDVAADVRYVQATGPATVTVTGPERDVSRLIVRGDSIRYADRHPHRRSRLTIVVQAPNIRSFEISGASTLEIEGYNQPTFEVEASGNAEVTAVGQAQTVAVDLSGNAEADLGALKSKSAEVEASGASEAAVAPVDRADLEISGAAVVKLLTRPPALSTDISGAGKLRQSEAVPVAGAKL